jgi:hypothetical protein
MLIRAINANDQHQTRHAMNALTTLATIALGLFSAVFNAAYAGGSEGGNASATTIVRRDLVGPDFRPATKDGIILMREVRQTALGYEVKVKAANGSLRMKGTFADEQLTAANGEFSYYHDNGRLESQGRIENGVKTGVWKRFDRDGNARNEKVYSGQTYDQLAVSNGWNAPQH